MGVRKCVSKVLLMVFLLAHLSPPLCHALGETDARIGGASIQFAQGSGLATGGNNALKIYTGSWFSPPFWPWGSDSQSSLWMVNGEQILWLRLGTAYHPGVANPQRFGQFITLYVPYSCSWGGCYGTPGASFAFEKNRNDVVVRIRSGQFEATYNLDKPATWRDYNGRIAHIACGGWPCPYDIYLQVSRASKTICLSAHASGTGVTSKGVCFHGN
ncbi:hypothetical protein [Thermosulfurimonas sp. F29]|uniref:hypothetical protein n=1 Tax=Thermosulfurimonas sp. F29 TaxID=2867247 RepID=UPI001C82F89C|nr:hypothetical protein [Thermosulfurimonas sp. F29]MBX6424180.1 hypothetical protein [Thermosulfurimonas sp. F29]